MPTDELLRHTFCSHLAMLHVAALRFFFVKTLKRRYLMALYSTGKRNAELRHPQVGDIDSRRMLIHIQRGKGGRDRVPLSPALLTTLRAYYWSMHPPDECRWGCC